MNLVKLSKRTKSVDKRNGILKEMEKIHSFEPDVILLYTNEENIELILQQVNFLSEFFAVIKEKIPHAARITSRLFFTF